MDLENITVFQDKGVVVVPGLLPKQLMAECLSDLIAFTDFDKPMADGNVVFERLSGDRRLLKYFQHIQTYIASFQRLYCSTLLDAAEQLLGAKVYFSNMGLHDKAPHKGTATPPHQDNFYWCLEPPCGLTAYVPLEKMSSENGGISYLPGSHKTGVIDHEKGKVAAFSSAIVEETFDLSNFYRPELKPGDVAFHHANMVHAADPNRSGNTRRALAVIIFGEPAKVSPKMKAVYRQNRRYNRAQ
jgi:phytanoyl-CoA hydroxylase